MILGIGADLCRVDRIRRSLASFGDNYINELFSGAERALCEVISDPALLFARAFCGKEACVKALGTGMSSEIGWRDIEVLQSGSVASLRLSEGALKRLVQLTPAGHSAALHISCSDDRQIAQAFVVISTSTQE